jgi:replicative DNA helicase
MSSIDPAIARQFERLPPHDLEAERCVLGSMLLADDAVRAEIRATINRGDFYQADHQIIFDAIARILDDHRDLDEVTLRAELVRAGVWEEIGGVSTLAGIIGSVFTGSHGRSYAETVRERSIKRLLIGFSNNLSRQAYGADSDYTGNDLLQSASERIASLISQGRSSTYWTLGEKLIEAYDQLGAGGVSLIPTGISSIDEATGGIGLGENIIAAGRPSMGKSTFLRQILKSAALAGVPTGIISLEEGGLKIARNILAAECGIENNKIRKANLVKEEWDGLAAGVAGLSKLPVFGSDTARSLQDIRAVVTTWVARHGVKLVILDYLQRVQVRGHKEGYERVSYISRELADLWKELNVAAIVAAQLNRGVEGRDNKRPIMSDLRDSGGIEQDADGILFLHREDYYHATDDEGYQPTGIAEFIIAKWRDGVRGKVVEMRSNLQFQRFEEIPQGSHTEPPADRPFRSSPARQQPRRAAAPAQPEWKPEAFVERFILEEPQSDAAIIEAACGQGLKEIRVKRLLTIAVEKGLAYRWGAADQTKPARYCRRKETLIESAAARAASRMTEKDAENLSIHLAGVFPGGQMTQQQRFLIRREFLRFHVGTVEDAMGQHRRSNEKLDVQKFLQECDALEIKRGMA